MRTYDDMMMLWQGSREPISKWSIQCTIHWMHNESMSVVLWTISASCWSFEYFVLFLNMWFLWQSDCVSSRNLSQLWNNNSTDWIWNCYSSQFSKQRRITSYHLDNIHCQFHDLSWCVFLSESLTFWFLGSWELGQSWWGCYTSPTVRSRQF